MAFPTIPTGGRVLTANQADASGTRTFPSLSSLTKNNGDLLIAIVVAYQTAGLPGAIFSSWGGGFTELPDGGDQVTSGTSMAIGIAYKISDGTETGTFTVTQASPTGHASFALLSIPGAHASTAPEAGTIANGTSAAADPGSFNPANWDAEDTLWIAVDCNGMTNASGSWTATGTAAPTNYGSRVDSNTTDNSTVGQTEIAVAFRQLNAASEDRGTNGQHDTTNARNSALIIAVRPSATVTETPIPGGALAGGNGATVSTSSTIQGALAAGVAPGPRTVAPQGGAIADAPGPYTALRFTNAVSDRVDHGSGATLDNLNVGTFLAWVKRTAASNDRMVFCKGSIDNSRAKYLKVNSTDNAQGAGSLQLGIYRATTPLLVEATGTPVAQDEWVCIAATWNTAGANGDQHLYVGRLGVTIAEVSAYVVRQVGSGTVGDDSAESWIGGNRTDTPTLAFPGDISFYAVWDRQLSLAELQALQFAPAPDGDTMLLAELGATVVDLSGNGNHGTVTGATQQEGVPLSGITARTLAPQGGAVAGGDTAPITVPVPQGGALAGGLEPPFAGFVDNVSAGGALAAGNAPTATTSTTQGGALANGATPSASVAAAQGGASAAGNAPSEQGSETVSPGAAVAGGFDSAAEATSGTGGAAADGSTPAASASLTAGGGTAGGFAPTEDIAGGGTSETPTPGGALAAGNGPTANVAATIAGGLAGGFDSSAEANLGQGGAAADGSTPVTNVALTISGALAGGNAPGETIAGGDVVSPGGASAGGVAPTSSVISTTGGAAANGTSPTSSTATVIFGGVADGTAPSGAVVLVSAFGALAGGFSPHELGTQVPGLAVGGDRTHFGVSGGDLTHGSASGGDRNRQYATGGDRRS